MEALMIVMGIVFAYLVFIALALVLARMIFPKIEIEEDEFLDMGFISRKESKKVRSNKSGSRYRKNYSLRSGKVSTGYTMP
jgi:hypothetical protein